MTGKANEYKKDNSEIFKARTEENKGENGQKFREIKLKIHN